MVVLDGTIIGKQLGKIRKIPELNGGFKAGKIIELNG